MNALKAIWLTLAQLLKQIGSLPTAMAGAAKRRRRRVELKELEIERLDRIRNPIKYRGK
jgi:hypothetical protein